MPKTESRKARHEGLSLALRRRLSELAANRGAAHAAALIGIHAQTYASLAAGFPGHRSTVALVERRLAELDAEKDGGDS